MGTNDRIGIIRAWPNGHVKFAGFPFAKDLEASPRVALTVDVLDGDRPINKGLSRVKIGFVVPRRVRIDVAQLCLRSGSPADPEPHPLLLLIVGVIKWARLT